MSSQVDAIVHNGWRSEAVVVQVIDGQHLPLRPGLNHSYFTLLADRIDLAVAGHGRGVVAAWSAADPGLFQNRAGGRIQARQDAALFDDI